MTKKLIKLLQSQIDKLNAEDFDLEAWKSSSVAVLRRVFGEGDSRLGQIEQLKIDYSSWALRDSNSQYKPLESCKRKGREIIHTAIEEIETFGLPVGKESLLKEFFSQAEVKILVSESDKKARIINKLKKEDLQALALRLLENPL